MVKIPAGRMTSDPITIKPTSKTETVKVSLREASFLPSDDRYTDFYTEIGFDGLRVKVGPPLTFSR